MNATAALPVNDRLPAILRHRPTGLPVRRQRIGDFDLSADALDHFNRLLVRLDRRRPPLDADSIATAARQLCDSSLPHAVPACISAQLKRATALICMLGDPTWATTHDAEEAAQLAIDYVRRDDGLIPDGLLQVGRLDDAIVIETVWPRVAAELGAYLDFCRVRRIEAGLRGVSERALRFSRTDWELVRQGEAAIHNSRWHVRWQHYLSASTLLFRVH